ncbi:MAG TPA: hypothetical protein VIM79_01665 [Niastella sp.]
MESKGMNSYFKTTEKITALFQQAINTLRQQGLDAANILFEEAFRHDPYNLNAHYELALYYAAAKNAHNFRYHFFICRNLDAAYKECILTHEVVSNAFNAGELDEIIAGKEKESYPIKEFRSVDPLGRDVYLRFHVTHIHEITAVYNGYDHSIYFDNCFNIPDTSPKWPNSLPPEELAQMEYFRLYYDRDRGRVDQPTEQVYETIKKLSPYSRDVRFLIGSEYESIIDEVIIQNGAFYFYRHFIDSDLIDDQWAYFESVVQAHPDDAGLRAWLCKQYLDEVLYEIQENKAVDKLRYLDNITRLNKDGDPWVDYLFGKIHSMKGELAAALDCFRKAVGKSPDTFEFLLESGKSLAIASSQYEESVSQLSCALTIRKEAEIYLYRALAYYKLEKAVQGEADINRFMNAIKPSNNDMLLNGGNLFLEGGLQVQAGRLLHAALEKNKKHEHFLKEARKPSNSEQFINTRLSKLATQREAICAALARLH